MNGPALGTLPGLPRDDAGPVFREPWEAQAFALAVRLHERGCFTWAEWAACLSQEIAAAQSQGHPDLGATYYAHWLRALERLALAKGLATLSDLDARTAALLGGGGHAHDHHDHGHAHD